MAFMIPLLLTLYASCNKLFSTLLVQDGSGVAHCGPFLRLPGGARLRRHLLPQRGIRPGQGRSPRSSLFAPRAATKTEVNRGESTEPLLTQPLGVTRLLVIDSNGGTPRCVITF